MAHTSRVLVAGDWHGDLSWAFACVRTARASKVDTIVHVGDFGFWPGSNGVAYLDGLNRMCTDLGVHLRVLPGNHDNYDYLESLATDTDGVSHPRSHIAALPRGYRFMIGDLNACAVGGAVSVDKAQRTFGRSWWPQEEITDAQQARIVAAGPTDILFTHDAPMGVATPKLPRADFLRWVGPTVATQSDHHQLRITRIADALTPQLLIHGHFHARYTDTLTSTAEAGTGTYTCTVEGLACEHMNGNLVELTVDGSAWTLMDFDPRRYLV